MKVYTVTAHVEGLDCSGRVTVEHETWEDPGGTTVEDITVVDEDDGAELDFEELDLDMQEKVEAALVEAAAQE